MTTEPQPDANGNREVVASISYVNGRRDREVPIDQVGAYVRPEHGMLWIGLRNPSPELLGKVVSELGACDKNQEEMLEPHRRPKIIDYGNMVLIVAITVEVEAERPIFGETQFLIGDGFLVTVRRGATAGHSRCANGWRPRRTCSARQTTSRPSCWTGWWTAMAAAAKIESVVEGAEQKLLIRGAKDSDIRRLYRQRRDLLRIHTVVSPLAEICRRLARVEMTAVDEHARPYFGEVADRVLRVDELFNSLREALAFAFEASLMIGQAAQNDTTRKLASWAAILAVPTAIAGIYGMNFEFMPELKSPWGYPVTLGVIVTICSVLYWRFRKSGWL